MWKNGPRVLLSEQMPIVMLKSLFSELQN